jgi:acyl dehydratase
VTTVPEGPGGEELPTSEHRHSRVQLFRFSAATWNSHRIHYDVEFARSEGHRDVVVQSTLLGEVLARRGVEAVGAEASLLSVAWRNEATVVADETLRWEGEIVASSPDPEAPGCDRVEIACRITGDDGVAAVTGQVLVRRPRADSSAQTRRS